MQGDTGGELKPVLGLAPTGRAKCRGCARPIARGELRFGERLPNPFAEGETTVWFHPACAAYKRPEPFLQALRETMETVPDRDQLERVANASIEQRRRPRIDGAERAPSGQAKCRHCHEPIARGSWRIRLVYFQDGRFTPGGSVHVACRAAYFETDDVLEQVLHFSLDLSQGEREELRLAFAGENQQPG
jgi:hypothetical protein